MLAHVGLLGLRDVPLSPQKWAKADSEFGSLIINSDRAWPAMASPACSTVIDKTTGLSWPRKAGDARVPHALIMPALPASLARGPRVAKSRSAS